MDFSCVGILPCRVLIVNTRVLHNLWLVKATDTEDSGYGGLTISYTWISDCGEDQCP